MQNWNLLFSPAFHFLCVSYLFSICVLTQHPIEFRSKTGERGKRGAGKTINRSCMTDESKGGERSSDDFYKSSKNSFRGSSPRCDSPPHCSPSKDSSPQLTPKRYFQLLDVSAWWTHVREHQNFSSSRIRTTRVWHEGNRWIFVMNECKWEQKLQVKLESVEQIRCKCSFFSQDFFFSFSFLPPFLPLLLFIHQNFKFFAPQLLSNGFPSSSFFLFQLWF